MAGHRKQKGIKRRTSTATDRSEEAHLPVSGAFGYGRPPIEWQFKKGVSGNPKGRPPGAKSLKTQLREALRARIVVPDGDGLRIISVAQGLIEKQIELGLAGSDRATLALFRLAAAFGALDEQEAGELPLTPAQQKIFDAVVSRALSRARGDVDGED